MLTQRAKAYSSSSSVV